MRKSVKISISQTKNNLLCFSLIREKKKPVLPFFFDVYIFGISDDSVIVIVSVSASQKCAGNNTIILVLNNNNISL